MKQVLSVGQIKHLQKIGIELRNTSMLLWHPQILDGIPNSVWDLSFWSESLFSEDNVYPAYTLQDILDKLPCFIGNEVLTMQKLADRYTCLYMEPYSRSIIKITESKENSLMQPMKCCAGASKTDMLKLGRRNNESKNKINRSFGRCNSPIKHQLST